MKSTRRILAIVLTVVLALSLTIGVSANSEDKIENNLVGGWFIHNGLRNNFHSYIGVVIQVGNYDLTVTSIGRMFYEGNTQEHNLKIVDAATGEDVPGAAVTVQGGEVEKFTYGQLEAPVTLQAGKTYYLLSEEHYEGDSWAEHGFRYDPPAGAGVVVTGGVFYLPDNNTFNPDTAGNYGFVGLDIQYTMGAYAVSDTENELISDIMYADGYLNALRDHGIKIGTTFTVGDKDIYVSELGRLYFGGGTNAHTMYLVDAATGKTIPGSALSVPAGGTAGEYTWGKLVNPIKLQAGKKYHVICEEIADDGDKWLEGGSLAAGNVGITLEGSAYWDAGKNAYTEAPGTFFAATSLKYGFEIDLVSNAAGEEKPEDQPSKTGDVIAVTAGLLFVSGAAMFVLKKKEF